MSSQLKHLELKREYIRCALCDEDNTVVKFRINPSRLQLSSVWIDNIHHPLSETETIVTCQTCGLVYVNPRLAPMPGLATYSPEQEKTYFEQSRDIRKKAYRRLIQQLPVWLGRRPQTLLDIGCGDGILLEAAQQAGIKSIGSEISQELIDLVRERLGPAAITSVNLAGLPEAGYDVITLINVIEHLRSPKEILQISARLLKSNGILLVHTPNLGGLPAKLAGAGWHHLEPLEHFYYFTMQTLSTLMRQAGFEPVGRFNLVTSTGPRAKLHKLLGKLGIYMDNGLGIVACYRNS